MRVALLLVLGLVSVGCNKRKTFIEQHAPGGKHGFCKVSEASEATLFFECEFSPALYATGSGVQQRESLKSFMTTKCSEIKEAGFKSVMVQGKFDENLPQLLIIDAPRLAAGKCILLTHGLTEK